MTLLLAVFWGYIIYSEIPTINTIIGAIFIVLSGIIITNLKKKFLKIRIELKS